MKAMILIGLALAIGGCDRNDPGPTSRVESVPADNTKVNERDQGTAALTPIDQGNNEIDLGITQKIRQGVVQSESLSTMAKNVKIITTGAVVTLRGPVRTETEKTMIGALAVGMPGVLRVDNQLEIAAN